MQRYSRRNLLKRSALAAGAVACAPFIVPSRALGLDGNVPPSERVNLAVIGVGGMGGADLSNFLQLPNAQVVALCDVDQGHLDPMIEAVHQQYASHMESGKYAGCHGTQDFLEILARPDIDAVAIATPDHWHAYIAIAAMKAGKDVYCEKPLSRTIEEGRKMVEAVRRYGRVLQVGTQSRSHAPIREALERIRNGRIGRIEKIHAVVPMAGGGPPVPSMPVPEGFDYDRWLGPAPWEPYTEMRCHVAFRLIRDYSGGMITDHGVHRLDIALWGADKSFVGPSQVEGRGIFPQDGIYDTMMDFDIQYRFDDGLEITVEDHWDQKDWAVLFTGTEGWVRIPMAGPLPHFPLTASDPNILKSPLPHGAKCLPVSNNHWGNFVDCVKTRQDPIASVEQGFRATSACLMGEISALLQRPLDWDPEACRFVNDDEANALMSRAMRAPWQL